jgi:hypothetical protein
VTFCSADGGRLLPFLDLAGGRCSFELVATKAVIVGIGVR